MSDRHTSKREPGIDNDPERAPVEFFDPWDRKLSFDRQSSLLSPVRREDQNKAG